MGVGQGPSDTLEEEANGTDAQTLASAAEAGAMGGVLAGVESSAGLEDLAERQVDEDAHREDHPAGDLEGEGTASGVEAASGLEDLPNLAGGG